MACRKLDESVDDPSTGSFELATGDPSFVSRYILSEEASYSRVIPESSFSGFTPLTDPKVAFTLSMTSCKVMFRLSMEKVLPEIVNVPVVMFEKIGRSFNAVFRFTPDASLPG